MTQDFTSLPAPPHGLPSPESLFATPAESQTTWAFLFFLSLLLLTHTLAKMPNSRDVEPEEASSCSQVVPSVEEQKCSTQNLSCLKEMQG